MCLIENLACMLLNMGYSESYPTSAERSPFKEKLEEADKGAKEAKKGVIFFLRVIDKVNRQKSSIVICDLSAPPTGVPPDTQIPVAKSRDSGNKNFLFWLLSVFYNHKIAVKSISEISIQDIVSP